MRALFDWSDLPVLLAFGRTGTLADAAAELGIDETTAARRLKRLEASLGGGALLARDGTKLRLTAAGRVALERAQIMEAAAEELARVGRRDPSRVTGTVRITSLGYVVNHVVIPALSGFVGSNPGVIIEIQSDNRNLSLAKNESDIAIRLGDAKEAGVASEKVGDLAFAVYRPRNRFQGVPLKRCPWIGPSAEFVHIPEWRWMQDNVPADRIVMRSNANMCNGAAVKAGLVCAVLPVLIGDNDKDMARMDDGVVLRREMWLVHRSETDAGGAIGITLAWLSQVFREIAPQLQG